MHAQIPRTRSRRPLVPLLIAAVLLVGAADAAEVKVDGSDVTYPTTIEVEGDELRLTGTGLREKVFINVYTVASYVAADAKLSGRAALAGLDAKKRLHLVMERDVDGETMAEAFLEAIEKNHDPSTMKPQIAQLDGYLRGKKAKDDDHIAFDHVPGKGVRISRTGREPIFIEGMGFARAVWNIYLGKENVSGDIAQGLVSRL